MNTHIRSPWELRRHELVTYRDTLPQPRHPRVQPENFSEEELHRITTINRRNEVEPPYVPRYPLGTWSIYGQNLYQLQRIPIARIRIAHDVNRYTVEKYVRWITQYDTNPPPIRTYFSTRYPGQYPVLDGHHRLAAQHLLHRSHIFAWVGFDYAYYNKLGDIFYNPLTYMQAVLIALKAGQYVDSRIVRDALNPFEIDMLTKLPAMIDRCHDLSNQTIMSLLANGLAFPEDALSDEYQRTMLGTIVLNTLNG